MNVISGKLKLKIRRLFEGKSERTSTQDTEDLALALYSLIEMVEKLYDRMETLRHPLPFDRLAAVEQAIKAIDAENLKTVVVKPNEEVRLEPGVSYVLKGCLHPNRNWNGGCDDCGDPSF